MPDPADFFDLPDDWRTAIGRHYDWSTSQPLIDFVRDARSNMVVHPDEANMFRAFHATPLDQVHVVILGQDPYPTPGHANGLAFSVAPGVRRPRSLNNIVRELENDLSLSVSNSGDLTPWTTQGVLLLNTVLTVRSGDAQSHRGQGWEAFTDAAIKSVSERTEPVAFWLWGRDAQVKQTLIADRHLILTAPHPSPMSARTGFFGSKPFSKTNRWLRDRGRPEINWRI